MPQHPNTEHLLARNLSWPHYCSATDINHLFPSIPIWKMKWNYSVWYEVSRYCFNERVFAATCNYNSETPYLQARDMTCVSIWSRSTDIFTPHKCFWHKVGSGSMKFTHIIANMAQNCNFQGYIWSKSKYEILTHIEVK